MNTRNSARPGQSVLDHVSEAWEIIKAAGYFKHWGIGVDEARLRENFVRSFLGQTAGDILLFFTEVVDFGVVRFTRQKSGHYLIHNFCILPAYRACATGTSQVTEFGLVKITELLMDRGDGDYEIIMDDKGSQIRRIYLDFHARGWEPRLSRLQRTHAFRCILSPADAEGAPSGLRTATEEEWRAVRDRVHHAGLETATVRILDAAAGSPVAAIVIDSAPEANCFGLNNRARIVSLVDRALDRPQLGELLRYARRFAFLGGGTQAVLLHADEREFASISEQGYKYVSSALHWIASRELLPYWRNHIVETLRGELLIGEVA